MMSFFQFTNSRHQKRKHNKTLRESFQQKRILLSAYCLAPHFHNHNIFRKDITPMYIHKHNEEAHLLRRRLELLDLLDDVVRNNLHEEELFGEVEMRKLTDNFKSVSEPTDVVKGLKKIYGADLKWKQ
jgi:hypothetical protein